MLGGQAELAVAGMSIGPGPTTLTRTPRGPSSLASARAMAVSAPLVALSTYQFAMPRCAPNAPLKITELPSSNSGMSFCTMKNGPLT